MSFRNGIAISLACAAIAFFPAHSLLAQQNQPVHLHAALSEPIPASMFGLHVDHPDKNWPSIPFDGWRLIDNYVTWSELEPSKGQWNLNGLNADIGLAQQHGTPVLLTLGWSPKWASARPEESPKFRAGSSAEPKDIQDWTEYVRYVAKEYKDRIHYWELWNEPNLPVFYTGTAAKMIEIVREAHTVLKEVDPTNVVTCPPPTGTVNGVQWLDQFFALGGAQYCDVIGYHFYVSPQGPEAMVPLAQKIRQVMEKYGILQKPLWATEAGWFISNHKTVVKPGTGGFSKVLNDEEGIGYVSRSYILLWASGVSRFFWYGWDNHWMGLTEEDGTRKPAAYAYYITEKWLIGAKMTGCDSDASNTWVCQITRDGGYKGYIVWNSQGSKNFPIPGSWHVQVEQDLGGNSRSAKGDSGTRIGIEPILLENMAP